MADCKTCKSVRANGDVPYVVHEAALARMERANKRLVILIAILAILLFGSNLAWAIYESQFDDIRVDAEQTGDGTNIICGGDIDLGTESDDNQACTQDRW